MRIIVLLTAVLSFGLAGCALPDLIAHTVKAVEKSQRGDSTSQTASTSSQPASPRPATEPDEPPLPQSVPMPRRSSVTAEELPPR